jgi:hypothetical protein
MEFFMLGVISIVVALLGFGIATSSSWYDLASAHRRNSAPVSSTPRRTSSRSTTATAIQLTAVPRIVAQPLKVLAESSLNCALTVGA